ncbi:uncharacterized protein E0L32_001248 [Thyridium curvatum]|uniref:Uncharacterized protein n=1 Tax=Thyridium curvatum TaxID=1093900 RepID=A0A507AYX2_9PEZI|nr:uncharacterized protein E0L32_001248 [Thyridium curvatum]TPX10051.1 hypothetical protein E0L32_001248 [Thyridium curvatum]
MPPNRTRRGAAPPSSSRKRKATDDATEEKKEARPQKARKRSTSSTNMNQTEISTESADKLEKPILINRSPVLELWGACVASFLHPDMSWNACINIGSSIATLTAIAKGRSIGKIAEPDPDKQAERKKKGKGDEGLPIIRVMGFPMTMKGDAVVFKGKERTAREANLVRKFGEENLGKVKTTMGKALESWRGDEGELDKSAFHMYERFRPQVPKGQQGWGRKGELHLSKIEGAVRKS